MTKASEQAFPYQFSSAEEMGQVWDGLTKREYFAAIAMQGFAASESKTRADLIAKWSVELADALITALNESEK